MTGPTDDLRRRERDDALTLQDTPECDARRSLRATTARFEMRLDVTPEFVLLLRFWFVVEYRDVDVDLDLEDEEEGVSFSCTRIGIDG